jgi:hypothetical protein
MRPGSVPNIRIIYRGTVDKQYIFVDEDRFWVGIRQLWGANRRKEVLDIRLTILVISWTAGTR